MRSSNPAAGVGARLARSTSSGPRACRGVRALIENTGADELRPYARPQSYSASDNPRLPGRPARRIDDRASREGYMSPQPVTPFSVCPTFDTVGTEKRFLGVRFREAPTRRRRSGEIRKEIGREGRHSCLPRGPVNCCEFMSNAIGREGRHSCLPRGFSRLGSEGIPQAGVPALRRARNLS